MRYPGLFLGVVVGLLVCSGVYADVPKLINFQGRLTDASGKFVTDGNYTLTFKLYADSIGGGSKWSETQSVAVSKGLFNVILGVQIPIPDSIFDYSNTWLGIQVSADPEMSPRQRLSSLGYSYRTGKADTASYSIDSDRLDGMQATDFASPATDFGRSGVATDLYEGTSTLTSKYVNSEGPDSVAATSGTAFSGKVSGSDSGRKIGIRGYADNSSIGGAWGGYFSTSSNGTGDNKGVIGDASISSSNSSIGVQGFALNSSTGFAYGGSFSALNSGTGTHFGVYGSAGGASSNPSYGCYGYSSNSSSGSTFGTSGLAYNTSTGTAYGSYARGNNSSTGDAYGGYFEVWASGTGTHYGVRGDGYSASFRPAYGFYGYASNTSTGPAYGGYFSTSSAGSAAEHIGVKGEAYSSSAFAIGSSGWADNTSPGDAYGGRFVTSTSGTGFHYGVYGAGYASSGTQTYGVYGRAQNLSTGFPFGGYFEVPSGGGTAWKYGIYAYVTEGQGYAGYFDAGIVVQGLKSAAVKVENDGYRLLYAQESPENWFEDFGKGNLAGGKAIIQIDPLFAQTVNTSVDYHVFLTPGGDCNGLYVTNQTATSFEVRELKGGNSDLTFSYRIVAKRKGYENVRLAKMQGPTPEEMAAMRAKQRTEYEQQKIKMEPENNK